MYFGYITSKKYVSYFTGSTQILNFGALYGIALFYIAIICFMNYTLTVAPGEDAKVEDT